MHPILDMLDALSVADAGPCCSRPGHADLGVDGRMSVLMAMAMSDL
jgi:hypothetical protein